VGDFGAREITVSLPQALKTSALAVNRIVKLKRSRQLLTTCSAGLVISIWADTSRN